MTPWPITWSRWIQACFTIAFPTANQETKKKSAVRWTSVNNERKAWQWLCHLEHRGCHKRAEGPEIEGYWGKGEVAEPCVPVFIFCWESISSISLQTEKQSHFFDLGGIYHVSGQTSVCVCVYTLSIWSGPCGLLQETCRTWKKKSF